MYIDVNDYLTQEQKASIGVLIYDKLMAHINTVSFTKVKININKDIEDTVHDMFEQGDVYDNMDMSKIGKALFTKVVQSINGDAK